jgi:hypothetical protein
MRDAMEDDSMKIDVFAADSLSESRLDTAFDQWMQSHTTQPDFVALHQSVPTRGLGLERKLGDVRAVHGATSCLGVMSQDGPRVAAGAGAFAIWDAEGDYGTALRPLGDDARAAARDATEAALRASDRPGEAPDVIWLSVSPGQEEAVLAGVEDVVGDNVPILGGSAADDTVSGDWEVFDSSQAFGEGVVVSVLFPSKPISFAYHNGYAPTAHSGVVTKAEGRLLQEIDGRRAAQVYREWTDHKLIPETVTERHAILSESTLAPLGRHFEEVGGVPFYLLFHPAGLTPDDGLELFADAAVGDTLTLMSGAPEQLTQRAGKVAALAAQSGQLSADTIAGSLMVYCGGCMLAVQDRLSEVSDGVCNALPDVPFMGIYTFGEQGMPTGGRNRHGNLMISAIVFAK